MYRQINNSPRMTMNEASEHYPDYHILLQNEEPYMINPVGIVLYIGDNHDELFALQIDLPVPHGVVFEGLNLQRRYSLGGIAVGEQG